MAPLSLTLPYPEKYIKKRLEYTAKVAEREKAIVAMQQGKQELFQPDGTEGKAKSHAALLPPIPKPPQVPVPGDLREITDDEETFGSEDQRKRSHPLYLPKNQLLVDHLDKRCFHITNGRYFGLSSNVIADPYFFGPNAPGIGGLNLSASTGLATASTGGGAGSLGAPLLVTPTLPPPASSGAASKTTSSASTKGAAASNKRIGTNTDS